MPNRKKHIKTGAIFGAVGGSITYLVFMYEKRKADPLYKFDIGEFLIFVAGGATLGAFAGTLPDLLEPGHHSYHRNICHSITAATAIGIGIDKATKSNLSIIQKGIISITGGSYLLHLMLDSETPEGCR